MDTQELPKQLIHKDMTIETILNSFPNQVPQMVEIMTNAGLHCVGCEAATFETLEQGILGHGFTSDVLDSVLSQLNEVVSSAGDKAEGPFQMNMTERAVKQIVHMMTLEDKIGYDVRVSVIPGGCSGFSYDMKFVEGPTEGDIELEYHGARVYVDPKSTEMLNGIEIDYVMSLNESGFKYRNPNANASCGCGLSFN